MKVYCPILLSGKFFPTKCTSRSTVGGQNASPPVLWGDVPSGTNSFLISFADALGGASRNTYWYIINIPPSARELGENASGQRDRMPPGSVELRNPSGDSGYFGPTLTRSSGPLEAVITVRALTISSVPVGPFSTPAECETHLAGTVLAEAAIKGIFQP
jgi:Raf kinase inhibitor-like YbhB/YbcL family protein